MDRPIDWHLQRARELERLGRHAAARRRYERALRLGARAGSIQSADNACTPAALLRWAGTMHRAEGDHAAASDCYEASFMSAQAAGNAIDCAHALNWRAVIAQEHGRADDAAALYEQAMSVAQATPDGRLIAMIGQNIGVLATVQGHPARALEHYDASLARVRVLRDATATATLLNNIGVLHIQLEAWADASAALDECAAICEAAGDVHTGAMAEVNRVELEYRRGDIESALARCGKARELAAQVEHHVALGEAYRWYGTLHRSVGRMQSAEAYLLAAAEIADRFDNSLLVAEVQRELGLLWREQERDQEALQSLSRAHAVLRELRAAPLLRDIEGSLQDLERIYLDVVRRWSNSIEEKDRYTSGHCQRVADYACRLASHAGIDDITLTWFRMGALLHDVGKIEIPEALLNKQGALTAEERVVIERHPVIGEEMLASMSFPWDIRPMVRGHHERWDGRGYPDGLAGGDIPLSARILCIADVFDALTTDRPYRPGFSPQCALHMMAEESGRMFDPHLFARFHEMTATPHTG